MKAIAIKDKNDLSYTVEIDEASIKKEVVNNRPKWSVQHIIRDGNGSRAGFGHLSITCPLEYEHINDEKILDILVNIGVVKIKKDIDNSEPIESKGYNIRFIN